MLKTRRIHVDENGKKTIVWFGSYGINQEGKAKFYNDNDKHDNYSTAQQAVVDNLIQKLSLIKGELWYNVQLGIPLFDKYRSKSSLDAAILSLISKQQDVVEILKFTSSIDKNSYTCSAKILSIYGEIEVNL